MRVAALNDIHGNLPALEAVLGELADESADVVVIGGDAVLGPMPTQTLHAIERMPYATVLLSGNCERELLELRGGSGSGDQGDLWAELGDWAAQQISEEQAELIKTFNATFTAAIEPLGSVLFCHGSPRSDEEILTAVTPEGRMRAICAGVSEEVVVCGHTHHQFDRTLAGKRVVNAGSVGLAYEGKPGLAGWALIGPDVELRQTFYDLDEAERRFKEAGFPRAADYASELRSPPSAEEVAKHFEKAAQEQHT